MKRFYLSGTLAAILFVISGTGATAKGTQGESTSPPGNKAGTVHIVGHAHMDMNWLWSYFETMKMCNDNLRQTVAFMEEYPDFTMIQSQPAAYRFVERMDPPTFQKIKKYVREGRLEPGGGMWTEGDTNLSSGEALSRSFLLGQKYFLKHFDRMAKVAWLPDNFGHASQLPQMFQLAGMDYFYFTRCKPYLGSFWWKGPDGSKVLCFGNNMPNGDVTIKLKDELNQIAPVQKRILHPTGVGDHGGGPTRANIEMVHELDQREDFPEVKFTTATAFFEKLSEEMEGRPTHNGEMQFIFEGCYTTATEIKEGNRNCERTLFAGEFLNALRWLNGDPYPQDALNDLWETVTFNQFHDILPGSAIYEANRQAVARYTETERKARELKNKAFLRMADEVKFREGMGQPVVAFNMQPKNRKAIVEATVYSHEEPVSVSVFHWGNNYYGNNFTPVDEKEPKRPVMEPGYGGLSYANDPVTTPSGLPSVLVRDGTGKTYPAQITFSKPTPPGFTSKVQFVDENVPAGGYKTYYIDMGKKAESAEPIAREGDTFETDYFKVRFDMRSGSITSLFDKRTGTEYVKEGKALNQLKIYQEDKEGGMKAWTINKIVKEEAVSNVESVRVAERGPVRACIETVRTWGNSRFIERTYLYKSYPRIEYDMEIHWLETGSDSTHSPMLRALFPLNIENPAFYSHVPFDVVQRPLQSKETRHYDGKEVPAQKWVDISDGSKGMALLNRTRYGHSYDEGSLRLTLMRAAGQPDIYPNLGKFHVRYALYPHEGDWKNGVWQEGDDFNVPVLAAEPPSLALGKGHATRPEEDSFISLDAQGVHITGIKKAEDSGELIIRFVETAGENKTVTLNLMENVRDVRKLNFIEKALKDEQEVTINGRSVSLGVKPHEIVSLGIKFY